MHRFAILILLFSIAQGHFPPHCRCVCHSGETALSRAKRDCALPGASICRTRLCRRFDFAGFACCAHSDDEDLLTSSPSPEAEPTPLPDFDQGMAKIHFASDNRSELFINSKSVATVFDPSAVATITTKLEMGDVLAIRAKDTGNWHGVIVAIETEDESVVTGMGMWKARRAFQEVGDYFRWTTKNYTSCPWPVEAEMEDGVIGEGMARGFPYETGAKYIWAQDSGEFHGVFLRLVWGGEEC